MALILRPLAATDSDVVTTHAPAYAFTSAAEAGELGHRPFNANIAVSWHVTYSLASRCLRSLLASASGASPPR